MVAYYNENDPKAAAWLCELIKKGHIAPGVVDTRSIEDVRPSELTEFTQCHFFAGIGGWSIALRLAGWTDDRPVWTGSCPCQPFSAAGKGLGIADERHLWPHVHWLIERCRPVTIFGEQVASKGGLAWLDIVQADLENSNYTSGAVDLCAAGFGAPHIRQRVFWAAHSEFEQHKECVPRRREGDKAQRSGETIEPSRFCLPSGMGHSKHSRLEGYSGDGDHRCEPGRDDSQSSRPITQAGGISGVADTERGAAERHRHELESNGRKINTKQDGVGCEFSNPRPTNGFWRDVDWLGCRDGKWRPVEPGTSPLSHGLQERVVRLRGYGNAIVPQVAAAFIQANMEL